MVMRSWVRCFMQPPQTCTMGQVPLSGALNGPDGEQLQRTSTCLTLHLQQPSRTLHNAGLVICSRETLTRNKFF